MTSNPFDLAGKRVLITGGGTGLGRHFAQVLADAGASVVLSSRRTGKLEETAALLRAAGKSAQCVPMDVGSEASIDAAFERIAAEGDVDVLINNAGVALGKPLLDTTGAEWDDIVDTNLRGALHVAQAWARQRIAHKAGGAIVNVASVLGFTLQKGTIPYAASKAGLIQLTKGMAVEWARYGIRANALAPGYFKSDISSEYLATEAASAMVKRMPIRRLGQPRDLDGALLLLASDASRYMTGTVVTVDGGLSLPLI